MQVAGTRPPIYHTADFAYTGVLDLEGRHWVVQYPLTDQGGTLLEAQAAVSGSLLEQLRLGNLPFDVMRPEGFASYEGRRAVVYPAPLGKPRSFESFTSADAREVGRIIGAIHSLPPQAFTSVGLPAYDAAAGRERLLTELEDATDAASIPAVLRRRWLNYLDDDQLWEFTAVPVHGDIADENLLWAQGTIRSVLGFGEARVDDPAVDIAPLLTSLDEAVFAEFVGTYRHVMRQADDAHLLERVSLLSEFALVRWLMHGVLTGDTTVIDDASVMLEQLAVEIEGDPELSPGPTWHVDTAESVTTAEQQAAMTVAGAAGAALAGADAAEWEETLSADDGYDTDYRYLADGDADYRYSADGNSAADYRDAGARGTYGAAGDYGNADDYDDYGDAGDQSDYDAQGDADADYAGPARFVTPIDSETAALHAAGSAQDSIPTALTADFALTSDLADSAE